MAPTDDPTPAAPLTYASRATTHAGHTGWAIASLAMASITWVCGWGGIFLFAFLTRGILNRPTDLDYVPLQVASALAILIAPPFGIAFGLRGMTRRMQWRGWALLGLVLSALSWALPLGVRLMRRLF